MTRKVFIERIAHQKGYRVSPCGKIATSVTGYVRKLRLDDSGYFEFGISRGMGLGCQPVPVHRLQAYQKFGEAIYTEGLQVRHLDGNCKNNCADNLALGTAKENAMDKPAELRKRIAGNANKKFDAGAVQAFYNGCKSYTKTKAHFKIKSSGTLHYILNTRVAEFAPEVSFPVQIHSLPIPLI